MLPATPPPALPLRPFSWALLPLQFSAQSGVNGDTLHHLGHCRVVCAAQAARSSIKAGPPESSRMPAPTTSPPLPALGGGDLPREGPHLLLHWLSGQVPAQLADGAGVACDTLRTMRKETCLLSTEGKTHCNLLSWPPCHFKVISNYCAPGGEGEPKVGTMRSLLKTQKALLTAQVQGILKKQARGLPGFWEWQL